MIDPYVSNKWYTIDLKIDWGDNNTEFNNTGQRANQKVTIYIDGKGKAETTFFSANIIG